MAFSLEEIDHATEYALGQLGYASLKEKQREVLTAFVRGSDTVRIAPDGVRLCYCLLPLVIDALRGTFGRSIVICVSPLTALMLDQRRKYAPRALATEFVGG